MKAMRKITMGITGWSLLAILSLSGWSQPTPTPQPTPVPFNPGCMMDEPDPDTNLISNGGLTEGILVSGFLPRSMVARYEYRRSSEEFVRGAG
jgi:hypothetical protein